MNGQKRIIRRAEQKPSLPRATAGHQRAATPDRQHPRTAISQERLCPCAQLGPVLKPAAAKTDPFSIFHRTTSTLPAASPDRGEAAMLSNAGRRPRTGHIQTLARLKVVS